jgi:hypothetical protein
MYVRGMMLIKKVRYLVKEEKRIVGKKRESVLGLKIDICIFTWCDVSEQTIESKYMGLFVSGVQSDSVNGRRIVRHGI